MYYGELKKCDIANGEGVRVSLFVSGCRNRCKDCFQPETWDFSFGKPFTADTEQEIYAELDKPYVAGLSLLGGDPFEPENQPDVVKLLRQLKEKYPQKSIWAFSGYLFDRDILSGHLGDWEITKEYLSYLDVLVDGPFVEAKKNLGLRFRGSENQRIIDVPASLARNEIVLWQDWQGDGKRMK